MTGGLDDRLVNALQRGLPICERPFARIADEFCITEDTIVERLEVLLERGTLSRFGPMFDAERMGGAFHLCAMSVPPEALASVVRRVNAHPEVAHNYEREHAFNMWFVLGSDDPEAIGFTIAEIESETGLPVYDMPKLSEYFVGLRLDARRPRTFTRREEKDGT